MAPARLGRNVFNRPTLTVARDLLGKFIVHRHGRRIRSAMITEVEAYKGTAGSRVARSWGTPDATSRTALWRGWNDLRVPGLRPALAAQLRHRRGRPPGSRAGAGRAGRHGRRARARSPGRGGSPGTWASTSVSMASTRRRRGASGSRTAGSRFPHMHCAAGRASGSLTRARTGRRGPWRFWVALDFVAPRHPESR
jgi:hypothetical protein